MKQRKMKKKSGNNKISSEVLAAFLDGNATAEESKEILNSLSEDTEFRELLHISRLVDDEMRYERQKADLIPMTAMAATCDDSNSCSHECEKFILSRRNITFDEKELLRKAMENGWQTRQGTSLHNVGRQLECFGLAIKRWYDCTVNDIVEAINLGEDVIAVVDGGELLGDKEQEAKEDLLKGKIPDHTVVVLSCDIESKTITIYDPCSLNAEDTYSLAMFEEAWNDSKNYLVIASSQEPRNYIPRPIDLSDVELSDDLVELREAIAENAHEVWAANRRAEGWTYGPERNDSLKQTPDMVPYSCLPESEKEYDREMAVKTIKLLKKLGYELIRREDVELYLSNMKHIGKPSKDDD